MNHSEAINVWREAPPSVTALHREYRNTIDGWERVRGPVLAATPRDPAYQATFIYSLVTQNVINESQ